ncbi:hypothetical protein P170DRAFT_423767 [Aspergillus steynii IBT 23096]|uniref:Uncharacterized protein n=1 Tax=Aspergillus steynii IBT 23096 TaxID=1392250 RepID=A0A2I2GJC7_9EURO|nr:uncharacterized protein P170DRAFT_423767 [Aspergillus steynii IBT 23096]PLB52980.1 hypothetical protein P170DRAFT_423767 [Aspergillus steynii IBT 23096]
MSSILRSRVPARVVRPSRVLSPRLQSIVPFCRRTYAQSSYGGEGDSQSQHPKSHRNSPTRDIEHPGPPPPDVSKDAPSSSGAESESRTSEADEGVMNKRPSNKANPTIIDARQSPNIDSEGNPREDVPPDVKRHNEEVENRHDRPYNHIGDEGKYQKGF